jgi:PKD repeat protein
MKKYLFPAIILLVVFTQVYGQRFQVTTGTMQREDCWAIVEDPVIRAFVAIGNVDVSGGSNIWISSYDARGTILTTARANTGRPVIARDICLAPPDPATGQRTYYVTGWTQHTARGIFNQMFAGRMLLNGNFLWYMENPIGPGNNVEGVAVVMEPSSGDAVVLGNVLTPGFPANSMVTITRFNAAGLILWSNIYNAPGNWIARELDLGGPACAAPMPGSFIITGEETTSGSVGPRTFAALYNGAGIECWRNFYPAISPGFTTYGDAGYDVVWDNARSTYCIAGVVQTGLVRAAASSTPYIVNLNPGGAIVGASIYLSPGPGLGTPMGLYPRAVSLGRLPGECILAGADFGTNRAFFGTVPNTIPPAPGIFANYPGRTSANSLPQPMVLNDAPPEDIVAPLIGKRPGYLMSTNFYPAGVFGLGDAHLVATDVAGGTPDKCTEMPLPNITIPSLTMLSSASAPLVLTSWGAESISPAPNPVAQDSCRDTCIVSASFTGTTTGTTVNLTGTGTGNGAISYEWDFGDGAKGSGASISYTYGGSGPYTACLTVYNINASGDTCTAKVCKVFLFCDAKAGFSYVADSCKNVTFTNTSTGTGPLTYAWYFDGSTTVNSTLQNPVFTFTTCGTHTATLIVRSSPDCADTVTTNIVIPCCTVSSDFCVNVDGRTVTVTKAPANPPGSFKDSIFVNGTYNPTLTAGATATLAAGTYSICLKSSRVFCPGKDTCCSTTCKKITVSDQCTALTADFWFQVRSGGAVVFTNRSTTTGVTTFWDFGDGTPPVSVLPASVTYAPGTYTACVTITRIAGKDTCRKKACKTIVVDPPCNTLAKFASKHCTADPLNIKFINQSTGAASYYWDFGDGKTSTATDTVYRYPRSDTFVVCLKATSADGKCMYTACYKVFVSNTSTSGTCGSPLPVLRTANPAEMVDNQMEEILFTDRIAVTDGKVEKVDAGAVTVYPNPASGRANVLFEAEQLSQGELIIVSASGGIVYQKPVQLVKGKNLFVVPIKQLAGGIYNVRILSGNTHASTKFVINNK